KTVCDSTSNGTDQLQNSSSNLLTPYREQPRSTRIFVAYPRPAFSSSCPKPCASLKKPTNLARSPFLVGPRRKKKYRSQTLAFPSETSRLAPLILAHRGSALPWLVDDRAALRLRRIWCVPTR
ncbi:unnamed protein product, partial [Ascophyllum nodosum]